MAEQAAPSTPPAPATAPATGTTETVGTPNTTGPAPTGAAKGNPLMEMAIMVVPMILIFYFLFIRPENRRRAEREKVMAGLKPKDKVVTIGGLFGTIVEIDGDEVVLLVDPKKEVKMRFRRTAIDIVEQAKAEK